MSLLENTQTTLSDQELLKKFKPADQVEAPKDLSELEREEIERLKKTGVDIEAKNRLGTYLQTNCGVVSCNCNVKGVELLPIKEAMKRYDGLKDYMWTLIDPNKDVFTKETKEHLDNGYFIRAKAGEKIIYPLQTCLYIRNDDVAQRVHNIVIAEEGSELHIITGCTTHPHLTSGLHIGISEFFVKKGAKLMFTMIHNWADEVYVRPRSAIAVEEGGTFLSNYVSLKGVKSVQTFPTCFLKGRGAIARFNSVIVAPDGSHLDTGSRIVLEAPETRGEIISRTISYGGTVVARGHLIGKAPEIKAHLECQGLMLADKGVIHAIPELEAHVPDVDMSHEAAVGKIAKEEIEYLMARGLSEEDATSTIVRGFLNVKIEGLPKELDQEIQKAVEECHKGM